MIVRNYRPLRRAWRLLSGLHLAAKWALALSVDAFAAAACAAATSCPVRGVAALAGLAVALMAAAILTEQTVHRRAARNDARHLQALFALPAIPDAARNTHRTAEEA